MNDPTENRGFVKRQWRKWEAFVGNPWATAVSGANLFLAGVWCAWGLYDGWIFERMPEIPGWVLYAVPIQCVPGGILLMVMARRELTERGSSNGTS